MIGRGEWYNQQNQKHYQPRHQQHPGLRILQRITSSILRVLWLLPILWLTVCAWSVAAASELKDELADQQSQQALESSMVQVSASVPALVLAGTSVYQLYPQSAAVLSGHWWMKVISKMTMRFKHWLIPLTAVGVPAVYLGTEMLNHNMTGEDSHLDDYADVFKNTELLPTADKARKSSLKPDPQRPNLFMIPNSNQQSDEYREELQERIFELSLDKETEYEEEDLKIVKKILANQPDFADFANNPEALKLMTWPALMSHQQIQINLKQLKDDQNIPVFSDAMVTAWNRRQLYNFMSHSVVNAIESHVYLGMILGGGEFREQEIADYYKVSPEDVLMVRAKLIERMKHHQNYVTTMTHKLPHDATLPQIEQALLSLSHFQIKAKLNSCLADLGLPTIAMIQRPLLSGRHIFDFYQNHLFSAKAKTLYERKDQKQFGPILLDQILKIRHFDKTDNMQVLADDVAFDDQSSHTFNSNLQRRRREVLIRLVEYFTNEQILLSPTIVQYVTNPTPPSATAQKFEDEMWTAYQSLADEQLAQLAQDRFFVDADFPIKSYIDNFLDIISASSVLKSVFLSQVLGLHELNIVESARISGLSANRVRLFTHQLKLVFLNTLGDKSPAQIRQLQRHHKLTPPAQSMTLRSGSLAEFKKLSPLRVLNKLISADSVFYRSPEVDEYVDSRAYHSLIQKIMTDPLDSQIFLSHFLHLDQMDLQSIAQMFRVADEEVIERAKSLEKQLEELLSSQLKSPRLAAQPLAVSVNRINILKYLNVDMTLPLVEQVEDALEQLRQADESTWAVVAEHLAQQTWFIEATPQVSDAHLRLTHQQFEWLDQQILDTPLKRQLFIFHLLMDESVTLYKLQEINNVASRGMHVIKFFIKAQMIQLISAGQPATVLAAEYKSGAHNWVWFQLFADRLAYNHLADDQIVDVVRRGFDDENLLSDVDIVKWRELYDGRLQARQFSDVEWLSYLYVVLNLDAGELTARLSPQTTGRNQFDRKVTVLGKNVTGHSASHMEKLVQRLKQNFYKDVMHSYKEARALEDESYEENQIGESEVDEISGSSSVQEWFNSVSMVELTKRLKQFYDRRSMRPWVANAAAISEAVAYIDSLDRELSWLVLGREVLGLGDQTLSSDVMAQSSDYVAEAFTIERDLLQIMVPRVPEQPNGMLLKRPKSLLTYSQRLLETQLRGALDQPQYRINPSKLAYFEKHYLGDNLLLWQIYMRMAGYRSEFKDAINIDDIHPLLYERLYINTRTALGLTSASSESRYYLITLISAFNYLRYPVSLHGYLSITDLDNYISTLNPLSLVSYLMSILTSVHDEEVGLPSSFVFSGRFLLANQNLSYYEDLMEFIANEVRTDPLYYEVFLRLILKLDGYPVLPMMARHLGISEAEIKSVVEFLEREIHSRLGLALDHD